MNLNSYFIEIAAHAVPLTINAQESLSLALFGGLVLANQLRAVLHTSILHTCMCTSRDIHTVKHTL